MHGNVAPVLTLVALIPVASAACSGGGATGRPSETYDSAGVTVVYSARPAAGSEAAWHTAPTPMLDLGGYVGGDLFRVQAARRLRGERIAFYNGGTCELRIVDLEGQELDRWGGCGQGPGEFSGYFWGIWGWRSDSLLVADGLPGRLSTYSSGGELGRLTTLTHLDDLPLARPIGPVGDRLLMRYDDPGPFLTPGLHRQDLVLATTDLAGRDVERVGTVVSRTYETIAFSGRLGGRTLLFSTRTAVAVGATEFFVGLPFDSYEIRVYSADGALRRIMRRAFTRVAVADRDVEWLMDRRLEEVDGREAKRDVRAAFARLEHAEFMPAFGVPEWPGVPERAGPTMLVDDTQNLWVFDYYRPGEYVNRWTVFDPEGRWLTTAELPVHLIPSQIGEDFVLGQWVDDLGLAHVQLWELEKP